MTATCSRCSRANPAEARFCYFDGQPLPGRGAQGPLHAGTVPFPAPFVFPSGLTCANFNQLAMGCQKNWSTARDYLQQGHWTRFMQGIGRLDLAKVAQQAQAETDADQGLDQFLAKVPAEILQAPKLAVEPTLINLGQLRPGANHKFDIAISNLGMRLLRGSVRVDCDWLTIGDAGKPELFFQTPTETHVTLRIVGKHFRGEAKAKQGAITVLANGGEEIVVVRAEAPIVPFVEGVFAGATTPREIAVRAKKQPKLAAGLFESGAVEAWYAANAWEYPVQGPAGSGLGAIQQFFEALGLVKAPIVAVEPRQVHLCAKEGGKVDFEIRVQSPEQKPVFAHAHGDQPWLQAKPPIFEGNRVTIPISVPVAPDASTPMRHGTVIVRANGNQKFQVPVTLEIKPDPHAIRARVSSLNSRATDEFVNQSVAAPNRAPAASSDDSAFGMGRMIYWSGLLGGWAAFIGWMTAEAGVGRWIDRSSWLAIAMVIAVSAAIGGGLSILSGLVTRQWHEQLRKTLVGLAGGAAAGLVGSIIGDLLYQLLGPTWGRVFGWTMMGLAIGSWEGVYLRDRIKIRNGLIGGGLGGFIGGLLFNPMNALVGGAMSSRAVGFVILGLCIGLLIGLVQVLLKDGWLTVVDGFRPGRQLILSQEVTTLGTSEKSNLIFIAFGAKGVEPIHAAIERTPQGGFVVCDRQSRGGTLVNGVPIDGPRALRDGDIIQIGVNKVRFNERVRSQPIALG